MRWMLLLNNKRALQFTMGCGALRGIKHCVGVHLHVVVLLMDILQVLLELLELNETIVCKLLVLL